MERLLHYVWKYRLYPELVTTTGIPFTVIDPGIHNTHAGPDFFNAKIKIGDKTWAGNVEIHRFASDWYRHEHHLNHAYDSVILHVVEHDDISEVLTKNERKILQSVLVIPDEIRKNYNYLLHTEKEIPCLERLSEIPEIHLNAWKNALTVERLQNKTKHILQMLELYHGDWEEVFYVLLCRNFGFGINGDAFELLAKSLPLKYIRKHQDNFLQVEALFFGQAGLLEEENSESNYYQLLQEEYRFLRKKFDLRALENHIFKRLRIRPQNFPHVKIAQLAALFYRNEHFFSRMLNINEQKEYYELFTPQVSDFWTEHYHFNSHTVKKERKLGFSALQIILINTVIPILFAYGKRKKNNEFIEKSLYLQETIPAEKNAIITLFQRAGVKVDHAADSQALIQLKREYCEKKECLFCRIGHCLLSNKKNALNLQVKSNRVI